MRGIARAMGKDVMKGRMAEGGSTITQQLARNIFLTNIHRVYAGDDIPDCPRISRLDKTLYACDELTGFITAAAMVRPTRISGLQAKSVRKKMKEKAFAAAVNRDDIVRGAEELGVDLNEHIQFVIDAMAGIADQLGLAAPPAS